MIGHLGICIFASQISLDYPTFIGNYCFGKPGGCWWLVYDLTIKRGNGGLGKATSAESMGYTGTCPEVQPGHDLFFITRYQDWVVASYGAG